MHRTFSSRQYFKEKASPRSRLLSLFYANGDDIDELKFPLIIYFLNTASMYQYISPLISLMLILLFVYYFAPLPLSLWCAILLFAARFHAAKLLRFDYLTPFIWAYWFSGCFSLSLSLSAFFDTTRIFYYYATIFSRCWNFMAHALPLWAATRWYLFLPHFGSFIAFAKMFT